MPRNHQSVGSDECWKRIGIQGDGSCPELQIHVHCRNCLVYSGAGIRLLDRPLPPSHLREWTAHYAQTGNESRAQSKTAFVFRVGREWLALPPQLFVHVLELRPIHSLPHRRKGIILGVVNVRGEILVSVSLGALLGLEESANNPSGAHSRLLVIARGESRFAFPADEVYGTHRYAMEEVKRVPSTVANAKPTHTTGVLEWKGRSIGFLDEEGLFNSFIRSLA